MRTYSVVLLREEDGTFSVEVPALPGCVTQGETRQEALLMAQEAVRLYLESLAAEGLPLPEERPLEMATVEVAEP